MRVMNCLLLYTVAAFSLLCPAAAMTIDYTASSCAQTGIYYSGGLLDSDQRCYAYENEGTYSYATVDYELSFGLADLYINTYASVLMPDEPNYIVLETKAYGDYDLGYYWDLADYYYQDANSVIEGFINVNDFPDGQLCALKAEITFPKDTFTGTTYWQFAAMSPRDYIYSGEDPEGPWGPLTAYLTVFSGDQAEFFFQQISFGDSIPPDNFLARSTDEIKIEFTAMPHPVDLRYDGQIDYHDFAKFAPQWQNSPCDPNTNWCDGCDFDHSGTVDMTDITTFSNYWLIKQ